MSVPTAAWETPALMVSLSRHGWGRLDGPAMAGVRRTLQAVVDLADHTSGQGTMTRAQIADVAGAMSERWAGRCLAVLEDLGVIRWHRGGLFEGQPIPGMVTISKRVLAAMARAAVGYLDSRRAERARATRARIRKTLRLGNQRPKRRNPLSVQQELSSPLLPYGGISTADNGGAGDTPAPSCHREATTVPVICKHHRDYQHCPDCTTQQPEIPRMICETCGLGAGECRHLAATDPSRHPLHPAPNPAWRPSMAAHHRAPQPQAAATRRDPARPRRAPGSTTQQPEIPRMICETCGLGAGECRHLAATDPSRHPLHPAPNPAWRPQP